MSTLHQHLSHVHPLAFFAERVRPALTAVLLAALAPLVAAVLFLIWVAVTIVWGFLL